MLFDFDFDELKDHVGFKALTAQQRRSTLGQLRTHEPSAQRVAVDFLESNGVVTVGVHHCQCGSCDPEDTVDLTHEVGLGGRCSCGSDVTTSQTITNQFFRSDEKREEASVCVASGKELFLTMKRRKGWKR